MQPGGLHGKQINQHLQEEGEGRAKRRRRLAKEAKRIERKDLKASKDQVLEGVDPDIAGIVPGPQPKPFE
jgi:hypothetical protein